MRAPVPLLHPLVDGRRNAAVTMTTEPSSASVAGTPAVAAVAPTASEHGGAEQHEDQEQDEQQPEETEKTEAEEVRPVVVIGGGRRRAFRQVRGRARGPSR